MHWLKLFVQNVVKCGDKFWWTATATVTAFFFFSSVETGYLKRQSVFLMLPFLPSLLQTLHETRRFTFVYNLLH